MRYTNITSSKKIGSRPSDEFSVTKELRQGCAIAPNVIKVYLNSALEQRRRTCRNMWIPINDEKPFNLHSADNQVIIAEEENDICHMLRKLDEEYQKWGLKINTNETEYIVAKNTCKNILFERGDMQGGASN